MLGDHGNAGKVAVMYGPLVLAADDALLASAGQTVCTSPCPKAPMLLPTGAGSIKTWDDARVYHVSAMAHWPTDQVKAGDKVGIDLVPFADAGGTGTNYKVWLPLPGTTSANVLLGGRESRSREGIINGSINDDDNTTFVITFNNTHAAEDWFAATLETATIETHGVPARQQLP